MNKRTKKFSQQIGYVLLIVFFARCYISKDSLYNAFKVYELFGCISDSVAITGLLMFCYERFLWRFNPFESTPKLKKDYDGNIVSTFDNKSRDATLVVQQTLLSIHITLKTDESRSQSVNASIIQLNGEKCLVYTYINTPNALVRDRSSIHYGTATLCIEKQDLSGNYYTDRKTSGVMNFPAIKE